MRLLLILLILFALDPPRLYVVPSRSEVMPGQVFSVTVTSFNIDTPITFDSGGVDVLTDTLGMPTRYIWLRAPKEAQDVRIRAWGGGLSSEAIVRVCCRPASFPFRRWYLPVVRH